MGHDLAAAAAMGQLRSVLRTCAADGDPPALVLDRLDRLVTSFAMADLATVVYARLSTGAATAAPGCPGPTPATRRRCCCVPDGTTTWLDGRRLGHDRRGRRPGARARPSGCSRPGSTCCCSPTGWWSAAGATSTRSWPTSRPRCARLARRGGRARRPVPAAAGDRAARRRHRRRGGDRAHPRLSAAVAGWGHDGRGARGRGPAGPAGLRRGGAGPVAVAVQRRCARRRAAWRTTCTGSPATTTGSWCSSAGPRSRPLAAHGQSPHMQEFGSRASGPAVRARPRSSCSRTSRRPEARHGMSERKPRGVSFESWVERQVREARERGAFDDLPGAGKPLPQDQRRRAGLGAREGPPRGPAGRGDAAAVARRRPRGRGPAGPAGPRAVRGPGARDRRGPRRRASTPRGAARRSGRRCAPPGSTSRPRSRPGARPARPPRSRAPPAPRLPAAAGGAAPDPRPIRELVPGRRAWSRATTP